MTKILYINLFREIETVQVSSIIKENKENYYLDFHSKKNDNLDFTNIAIEAIPNFPSIYNEAVKQYTSFVAQLSTTNISKKHIRSFSVNNLPLFWLTRISEKHYFHWLMKVFLLKEIISSDKSFFKNYDQLFFVIPPQFEDAKQVIQEIFYDYQANTEFIILNSSKIKRNSYLSLLKISIKTIVSFFNMKQPQLTETQIPIVFLLSAKITKYTQEFFNNIIAISKQEPKDVSQIPLYFWNNSKTTLAYKVPILFWKSKPKTFSLIKIFYIHYKSLCSIKRIDPNEIIKINNISLPATLLIKEFENVFINMNNSLIMSYWLCNYKKNLNHKVKFFYEDEFYPSGRALSFALRNTETYGVQHSNITKNHTVYHISDLECKSSTTENEDGMPLPFKFIVWGDYFKHKFLSHNSLPNNFVYSAGNSTYIKRVLQKERLLKKNETRGVLYCLSTPEFFFKEKNIIKDSLDNISNLKIRFHPLWKFDKNIVSNFFKNIDLTFSDEENIFEDIKQSTLIITGSHSGVWLDAIVENKPVIRIETFFQDNIEQTGLMHLINNYDDMKNIIQKSLNNKSEIIDNELLYLKTNRWQELLLSENDA
ncbi:MAG: hypothetical protein COB15_03955 [Flavobacteriales bacterium]|nr:MAG: hypothetical protein COB15_03955 [Flavobacteriales bacterium]